MYSPAELLYLFYCIYGPFYIDVANNYLRSVRRMKVRWLKLLF